MERPKGVFNSFWTEGFGRMYNLHKSKKAMLLKKINLLMLLFLAAISPVDITGDSVLYGKLPGGGISQLSLAGGYLFAVVNEDNYKQKNTGYYLFRSKPDNIQWELILKSDHVYDISGKSFIKFIGEWNNRLFFNLNNYNAGYTLDGGNTWLELPDLWFSTNIVAVGTRLYAGLKWRLSYSDDKGENWTSFTYPFNAHKLHFIDGTMYGFLDDRLSVSHDTGLTWNENQTGMRKYVTGNYSEPYSIISIDGNIVCSYYFGAYTFDSTAQSWIKFGTNWNYAQYMVEVDGTIYGGGSPAIHEYNSLTHTWDRLSLNIPSHWFDQNTGFVIGDGYWMSGTRDGIARYDIAANKITYLNNGLHQKSFSQFMVSYDKVLALFDAALYLMTKEGEVSLLESFSRNAKFVNRNRADEIVWVSDEAALYRFSLENYPDVIQSKLSAPYYDNIIEAQTILSFGAHVAGPDVLSFAISRNGGDSFELYETTPPPFFILSAELTKCISDGFIRNDTMYVFSPSADYLAFSLSDSTYHWVDVGINSTQQIFKSAEINTHGLFYFMGDTVLKSTDGGETWGSAAEGIFGGFNDVQRAGLTSFLRRSSTIYYTDWSTGAWDTFSIMEYLDHRQKITGHVVKPDGLWFNTSIDGVYYRAWPDSVTVTPVLCLGRKHAVRRQISFYTGKEMVFRNGNKLFTIQGKPFPWHRR